MPRATSGIRLRGWWDFVSELSNASSASLNEKELGFSYEKRAKFSVHEVHKSLKFHDESIATIHSVLLSVRQDDDDGRIGKLVVRVLSETLHHVFKRFGVQVFLDDDFVPELFEEPI